MGSLNGDNSSVTRSMDSCVMPNHQQCQLFDPIIIKGVCYLTPNNQQCQLFDP